MKVRLDRKSLLDLVHSVQPEEDNQKEFSTFGYSSLSACTPWKWHCEVLEKLSDQELYELYLNVRNSHY